MKRNYYADPVEQAQQSNTVICSKSAISFLVIVLIKFAVKISRLAFDAPSGGINDGNKKGLVPKIIGRNSPASIRHLTRNPALLSNRLVKLLARFIQNLRSFRF